MVYAANPENLKSLLRWALLAFVLHGAWEIVQLPLYTLWENPDRRRVVLYLLHCTAGDVLITTSLFLLMAALFRSFSWPTRQAWFGGSIMIAAGLAFTAYSEWYNVYQARAWSYDVSMPLVFGIGLTPLLQWMMIPVVMIVLFRRRNDI
jgi:hypothetical protein